MKKLRNLGILILILLLSACVSEQIEEEAIKEDTKEDTILNIPLNIDTNAEISVFNEENLYYFTDEVNEENPDFAKKTLHEYNFEEKKSTVISSYNDVSIYSGSKVITDNKLYFTLSQKNNDSENIDNILAEINLENKSSKLIRKWPTNPPLSFVYTLKNNLILFGPNTLDESTIEYSIDSFNPINKDETNIVTKKVTNQEGIIIPSLDVEENYIYAFSINITDKEHEYNIVKYDLTGKQVSIYPFDLQAFLDQVKTLVDQDDAIFKIYKEKNYFILTTLNGSVFILKLINNELKPVEIPDDFYKENPSGYRFIEYYDGESDFAYFFNTFENNNVITVFNFRTEKITKVKFPEDNKVYNYFRNAKGDLIVNTRTDSSSEFYHYNVDYLLEISK